MPRVVHFDIGVDDVDRAIDFYSKVFNWSISKWDGPSNYWLIDTGPEAEVGINGGLFKRREPTGIGGENAYVCTIEVPEIDEYLHKIQAAGGAIIEEKREINNVGWIATCEDTEGNCFSVMESMHL